MSYEYDYVLDAFSARLAVLEETVEVLREEAMRMIKARLDVIEATAEAIGKPLPDVTRHSQNYLLQQAQQNQPVPKGFEQTVWADYPQR